MNISLTSSMRRRGGGGREGEILARFSLDILCDSPSCVPNMEIMCMHGARVFSFTSIHHTSKEMNHFVLFLSCMLQLMKTCT